MKKKPPRILADLRGAAQLATDATAGISRIAEGVHQSVWSTLGVSGRAPGQTGGLTGWVYEAVRGVAGVAGRGAGQSLALLERLLQTVEQEPPDSFRREAVLAALNGVMGDRLAASGNPLATNMSLRYRNRPLAGNRLPAGGAVSGKILLMVHGLCMNDLQWQPPAMDGTNGLNTPAGHGEALAAALGMTPVYVRYNTGLHISSNGQELARQLDELTAHWPVPVEHLSIVAHSMGGLVSRSAAHYAAQSGLAWAPLLRHMVFLGTPHHGAPLERAGSWVDLLLGSVPWSRPFTRLTSLRSAGITDLRRGHVRIEDWQGRNRFDHAPDTRHALPLPPHVACHAVAATLAGKRGRLADRLVGDGLVPLHSALGDHTDTERALAFDAANRFIAYRTNHMQLLTRADVREQLVHWLAA